VLARLQRQVLALGGNLHGHASSVPRGVGARRGKCASFGVRGADANLSAQEQQQQQEQEQEQQQEQEQENEAGRRRSHNVYIECQHCANRLSKDKAP
jgi:hypothetical protein